MKHFLSFLLLLLLSLTVSAQRHPAANHTHRPGYTPTYEQRRPPRVECATPEQMTMVLQVLEQQSFDDKKLQIAELCVTIGRFCTSDLARMAATFSYDDSRLTFLLYAHPCCQDPQNYPALRDVFSFSSNYDLLMQQLYPNRKK